MIPRRESFGTQIKNAFTANIPVKFLALAISIVLFAIVHGAGDAQRVVWVDVVATLPAASSGHILVSEVPDRVKVVLTGRRAVINALNHEPLPPIQIDLRDTTRRLYTFEPSMMDVPAGLEVVQVSPPVVTLRYDASVEVRLSVSASFVGTAKTGLELKTPVQIEPATVIATGPESEIARVHQIATEPIDLSDFAQGVHNRQVALERQATHISFRDIESVRVAFELAPKMDERLLRKLPITVTGGMISGDPKPARADVRLRGPDTLMRNLDEDQILLTVDATGLVASSGSVFRRVIVRGLPNGVEASQILPPEVLVTPARAH